MVVGKQLNKMFNRVDTTLSFDLRSYSNEVDGKHRGVTVESYGRTTSQVTGALVSTPLKSITLNAESDIDRIDRIAKSIYNQLTSEPLLTYTEYRNIDWPPIMRVPSDDLKRCFGDVNMDNRTLKKWLKFLGFRRDAKFIVTEELTEKVRERYSNSSKLNLGNYKPQSKYGKELL